MEVAERIITEAKNTIDDFATTKSRIGGLPSRY